MKSLAQQVSAGETLARKESGQREERTGRPLLRLSLVLSTACCLSCFFWLFVSFWGEGGRSKHCVLVWRDYWRGGMDGGKEDRDTEKEGRVQGRKGCEVNNALII